MTAHEVDGIEGDLITSSSWRDPATLQRLRSLATLVTVQEGEARVLILPLAADR